MNSHAQIPEQNGETPTRENQARPILKRTLAGEDDAKTQAIISELVYTRQGLKQRHIQMIALAGTIGTGLFLATGKSLARSGPLIMLLAYCIVDMLICCVVLSVAELSALAPLSGGIIRHAEWFVDPALAFAQGWNSVYANAILLPAEMVTCAVIIDFWSDVNHASICITAGAGPQGYPMGFQFWRDPGPFVQFLGIDGSWGRFLGFWRVPSSAAYAFSNVEDISVAAAETQNPRHNIPKAAKRVFWRFLMFYLITICMMGLIAPFNDKGLVSN
ncbi:unnamed protein product [Penicillium nalgiovense]|nr:unnamed protein product [Penicillium nalgiovense]